MSNLKRILYITIIAVISFSCTSDFLDLYPVSSQTTGSFYKSQEDFDQALNACYKKMQDYYDAYTTYEYIIEAKNDDVRPGPYGSESIARYIDDATSGTTADYWSMAFGVINTCNQLITYINDAEEEIIGKDEMVAQARFIRGLIYFDLVRIYGGMPLYDQAYAIEKYYEVPRSTVEATYDFIYADFQAAANVLPDSYSGDDQGKATSYAAKGFLAKAYLYSKDYTSASPLLDEIISSGYFQFYDNWQDIFDEENDNGPQAIFQVQFASGTSNRDQGCQYLTYCAPENIAIGPLEDLKYPLGGATTQMIVSHDLYDSFEDGDIRRDLTICTEYLNKQDIVNTSNYFVWKFTHKANVPSLTEDWGLNRSLLRYTDILMMKAECINQTTGPTAEAIDIVNQVRNRAGLPDLTTEYTSSSDGFLQAIVRERRHEFAFENQRWFDLVRWGIAEDVMNDYLADMEVNVQRSMDSHQELYPIPAEQIEIVGDENILWQNPGY